MTILDDRAFARSLGASCLLHGAALALVLVGWQIEQKPSLSLQPIPVTLVRSDDAATTTLATSATDDDKVVSPPPAHSSQAIATTRPPQQRTPPRVAPSSPTAAAPPREAKPSPKPSDAITALIGEGVNGKPLASAPGDRDTGIRSSAPVSDDYLVLLGSWLARFQSYPEAAMAKQLSKAEKRSSGFTVTLDGNDPARLDRSKQRCRDARTKRVSTWSAPLPQCRIRRKTSARPSISTFRSITR